MDWFYEFPEMGSSALRALKKSIDSSFRDFTREHGELMEQIFDPLKQFLIFSEQLLTDTPWPIVIAVIAGLAWFASRSLKIAIGTVITLLLIPCLYVILEDFKNLFSRRKTLETPAMQVS